MDYYNTNDISREQGYFGSDTEYLDRFMSESAMNQEEILASRRRGYTSYSRTQRQDAVKLEYIDTFLSANGLKGFDHFNRPFCVSDGSTYRGKNKNKSLLCMLFISGVMLLLLLSITANSMSSAYYTDSTEKILRIIFPVIFGAVPIGIMVFSLLGNYLNTRVCTKQVDAVCVDLYSRISRDSDGDRRTVYKPFFYINYYGRGYILFNNTWSNVNVPVVGQIVKDIYINPDNPLEYCKKMSFFEIIFMMFFCVMFGGATIIMLVAFTFS